jgi:hypothetical protein
MSYNKLGIKLSDNEMFLCEVLTHREHQDCNKISSLYYEIGDEVIFSICKHNKIESIAAQALTQCVGADQLPKQWKDAYAVVDQLITSYMKELDRIASILLNYQIHIVALKNSGITRGLYTHYGACPMGDLDVLVRKSDFRKAHQVLIGNGYELKFRSPLEEDDIENAEKSGGAEYSVNLPDGTHLWFELQWRPVAGRWIRPDQEPDAEELMLRSLDIEGTSVRILSSEDNLLQVALHTAKHSYVRAPGFRLHTDVDRIVHTTEIDWDLFLKIVEDLQVKTAVFFSLALAHDLLKTPIPQQVLVKLQPSKWKIVVITRWLQKVGLFDPDGKKWSQLGYIVFVSLLYDTLGGLLRGVIPDKKWMLEQYGVDNSFMLPYLYLRRLFGLLLKRTLS